MPERRGRWTVTSARHYDQDANDGSAARASGGHKIFTGLTAGSAAAG
jgi:hypothetical protein